MENRNLFLLQGHFRSSDRPKCFWGRPVDLIPGRLAFAIGDPEKLASRNMKSSSHLFHHLFVTSDLHKESKPFATDPELPNLGLIFRFCRFLSLRMRRLPLGTIVYCIDRGGEAFSNAAFLLGSYLILNCGISAPEAAQLLASAGLPLVTFPVATDGSPQHRITLRDCFTALERASSLGWFSPRFFDSECYERISDPFLGAVSEISPRLLAFEATRTTFPISVGHSDRAKPPEKDCASRYLAGSWTNNHTRLLHLLGTTCIVRTSSGIQHQFENEEKAAMSGFNYFAIPPSSRDCGSNSPALGSGPRFRELVEHFLSGCAEEHRVAMCFSSGDAALPAALLASWLIRRDDFSAGAAIAWLRIVRPGAGVGPYAPALCTMERPPPTCPALLGAASSAGSSAACAAVVSEFCAARAAAGRPTAEGAVGETAEDTERCGDTRGLESTPASFPEAATVAEAANDDAACAASNADTDDAGGSQPRDTSQRAAATEERMGWAGIYDLVAKGKLRRHTRPAPRSLPIPARGPEPAAWSPPSPSPASLRWPRRPPASATTVTRGESPRSRGGGGGLAGSASPGAADPTPVQTAASPPKSACGRRGALLLTGLTSGMSAAAAAAMLAAAVGGDRRVRRRAFVSQPSRKQLAAGT